MVNHLIYDAFGRVTSENKNLSEKVNIGVIPRTHFGFRIGSNPATGDIFFFNNCPLLVSNSLFVFTGRPFDSDTQLQNNLNRWYDAHVGRWLSEDPIGFNGGDGNLYRYVKNRPIMSTDPSGKGDEHSSDPNTTFLDAIEAANTVKDLLKEVADPTKPGSLTVLLDLPSNVLQEQLSK
uniref:RHS repeat-associated core domain-containing protein n=1 Tax=Thermogutta sp. TaxID=1962930 RepID=UPI0032201F2F